MPISVPTHLEEAYGGAAHFGDVYAEMISPAVGAAGLVPLPPASDHSENIQAAIINALRGADLVVADLSTLNANVFLELGIRTALDLPVCLIHDGLSDLPFDYTTITTHKYDPLPGLNLNHEIQLMAAFIERTIEHSTGRNELWRYFGSGAQLPPGQLNDEDAKLEAKVDRLSDLIEGLSSVVASGQVGSFHRRQGGVESLVARDVAAALLEAGATGVHGTTIRRRCQRLLGEGYDGFFGGSTLSGKLVSIGVPVLTDGSGRFFLDGYQTGRSSQVSTA